MSLVHTEGADKTLSTADREMMDLRGGCVHGAGRHLDVGMVCWDGGMERQCGWGNEQVGRWICRWVKVARQGWLAGRSGGGR